MPQYTEGMTLQEAIEKRMSDLDLHTQDQVAMALGVTQSTVSRWTKGSAPRDEQVENLAVFLDTDEDTVLRLLAASRSARLRKQKPPTWASLIDDKNLVEKLARLPKAERDQLIGDVQHTILEKIAEYEKQQES